MIFRSHVRDCLVLNWVLPHASLPLPPSPLRYEVHAGGGQDWVFASALLFRHEGVHSPRVPWLRLSHPQMNVRLYVFDEEGVPSVLFRRMFVPFWAMPGLRVMVGGVARGAEIAIPSSAVDDDSRWRVRGEGRLEVATRLGVSASLVAGSAGSAGRMGGPCLGSFERTVEILQDRPRGYTVGPRGLQLLGARHPAVSAVPVKAEIHEGTLVERIFPGSAPILHSSWVAPDTPFEFELHPKAGEPLPAALPHPAASRSTL